jgi:ATP-dependent RNA helicase RhlE
VEIFVLDEADRMLDMGFIPDIRRILQLMPPRRQNLLFSATFAREIKELADKLLSSPTLIEVASRNSMAKSISHVVHPVDRHRKRELLSFIIGSKNWRQVLVFTKTKHGANRLSQQLESDGLSSTAIHGNKSQGARTRALAAFKQGKVRVLVATDVAARGIDIDKLPHVVNFDLPSTAKDYVHRVGRTGRASSEGMAVSLVSADERGLLRDIEKLLQTKVPQEIIPGYAPNPSASRAPSADDSPRRRFGGGRAPGRNFTQRRDKRR